MPPRRISPSQFRSRMRQAQAKAERDFERELKKEVKKAETAMQRELTKTVNEYNRKARVHNRRLQSEIARLNSRPTTVRYTVTRTSALNLHTVYRRVEHTADTAGWDERSQLLVDLAEAEAANSALVANTLADDTDTTSAEDPSETSSLSDELSTVSHDLHNRWQGALYAISGANPDAARHFCTSAREIIIERRRVRRGPVQAGDPSGDCGASIGAGDWRRRGRRHRYDNFEDVTHRRSR